MEAERAPGALPLLQNHLTTNDHGGGGLSVFRGVAFGNLPLFTLQATPIKLNGSPQQHQEDMKVVGGHYGKKGFSTSERKMRKGDVGVKVIKIYMYEIIK